MIAGLVLIALAACQFETEWNKFKIAHSKKYSALEEEKRFAVFVDNMHYINLLNKLDSTATYGVTKFADLTSEEFAQKHLGFIPMDHEGLETYTPTSLGAPEAMDWTLTEGAVSPIQDQGSCGSCWAFGTVAGLETALFVAGNKLVKLSEQNLVDCDTKNSGCDGGNLSLAERYLKTTGVVANDQYPYKGVQRTCGVKDTWTKYHATESAIIKNEKAMVDAVAQYGILPVAINATPVQFYTGGILDPKACSPSGLNHAVVVVGYGTENGVDYWKIRNSWGTAWGEEGYFRMVRGKNACGVAADATYIKA